MFSKLLSNILIKTQTFPKLIKRPLINHIYIVVKNHRFYASHRDKPSFWENDELPYTWISSFEKNQIPRLQFQTQFCRSSGPGGQNVNKVATKAEIRFQVDNANWLPLYIRNRLKTAAGSRVNRKGEYVITSSRTRSQANNLEDCIDKLYQDIVTIAGTVKKPTSVQSSQRINQLKKAEEFRNKLEKKVRSDKKAARRQPISWE